MIEKKTMRRRLPFGLRIAVLAVVAALVLLSLVVWYFWPPAPRSIHVQRVATFAEHADPFTEATFSGDGKLLAVSDFKHNRREPTEVLIENVRPPRSRVCVFEGPEMQCYALSFHPAAALLAMGGDGGVVKIADVQQRTIVQQLEVHGGPPSQELGIDIRSVRALAFSPDGEVLAIGTGRREVEIWSTKAWQRLHTLPGHSDEVNDLAFSRDGGRLISAGGRWESIPNTVSMTRRPEIFEWDTNSWKKVREFQPASLSTFARRAIYLGDVLAAFGDYRGNLSLINTSNGDLVTKLVGHENAITGLAFDGVRNLLISTSAERTIIWDLDSFTEAATLPGTGFLAYDPTQGMIATAFRHHEKTCVLSKIVID